MGFALILFLLPWISLSCGGQKVFTFSGTDMAIGKTIEPPQAFGKQVKQTTREWKATLALIAGIIGAIAGFAVKEARVRQIFLISSGSIGGISLFLLRNKLNTVIFKEAGGMVAIDYHFGFWAAMLLFFGVGILNVLSLKGVPDRGSGSVDKAGKSR